MDAELSAAHQDFGKRLNAHAYFKIRDSAKSEDLVQDTFLKTWVYLAKGGQIHLMKAFLYHILNNLIIDEYRKHKTSSLDILIENGFEPVAEESTPLTFLLDAKAVLLLIKKLPKPYQKIMQMKYVQDLSLAEMSLITGQSKNSIAVQTHRGLTKLKDLYDLEEFNK